jgi:uncharacterized protein
VIDKGDLDLIRQQLDREPRGLVSIAARCPCSGPLVVQTEPRLPDGTPFPTMYYITCPRLAGAIGTLESSGLMREMQEQLDSNSELASHYRRAHENYLADRNALGHVPELDGISAGGMPARVKCLHVLIGHSLAAGPGVNPLGDQAREQLQPWWVPTSCCTEAVKPSD